MNITPLDVEKATFKGSLFGINRKEVEEFLNQVASALQEANDRCANLGKRIDELETSVSMYKESEELLKNSIVLAQQTSERIVEAAKKQGEAILQEARIEERELRKRIAELENTKELFEYQFIGLLRGFLQKLEKGELTRTQARDNDTRTDGKGPRNEESSGDNGGDVEGANPALFTLKERRALPKENISY